MKKTPSEGWILYHRESINHHLRSNMLVWNYWVHCLEEAAWKDHTTYWKGREYMLKRGSFITSIEKDCMKLNLSISNVRTARKTLEACKMVCIQTDKAGTLIEVTNFNEWQDWETIKRILIDKASTKEPQDSHKIATRYPHIQNKGNKDKNDNNLSAGAHENENGCGVDNFGLYKLYVKDGCPNISNDDIKDSWRLGLHYTEAVELFSTENP